MIIAGLDPGKTGALVTLFEDGSTIVDRVPLVDSGRRTKKNSKIFAIDERQWARSWGSSIMFNSPDVFVVEQVNAWSGQGVTSAFNFGKVFGFARALVMSSDAPIHPAPPNVWKIKLGLLSLDKNASRQLARDLIPSLAPHITRAMDDGVAEAGLLAYYGKMTISG